MPVARPVGQTSILNLIVFKGGNFLAVVVIMFDFLHALNGLLSLNAVAENIQQIDGLHILVGGFLQRVVHPFVGLAPT